MKRILLISAAFLAATNWAQQADQVGAASASGVRYATDAYPGFDADGSVVNPERKVPKWFAFINGPNRDNAHDQFAYCQELENAENWSKAAKHYDALVREWPAAPEAMAAQRRLAEILYEKENELDEALEAYRYLLDFYSFRCDYDATANRMYEVARKMEEEGKTLLFFRFRNTTEVRHALEGCVLRAPGAEWVPQAMLSIAGFREEEQRDDKAVAIYENLRNLYYSTTEARTGTLREAKARFRLLENHGYNRSRCQDTVDFLEMARTIVADEDVAEVQGLLDKAKGMLELEAYKAAKFYDSKMRTRRSAIGAYERFLNEYPNGKYADEVRARLMDLKGKE